MTTHFKITIDEDRCIGSGECALAAPAAFSVDDSGVARVEAGAADLPAEELHLIAQDCPSGAITVEERTGGAA